MEVTDEEAR